MKNIFLMVAALFSLFASALAQENVQDQFSKYGACGLGFGGMSSEIGCVAASRLNSSFDLGLRLNQEMLGVDDDAVKVLFVTVFRPGEGSFYIEAGLGGYRYHEYHHYVGVSCKGEDSLGPGFCSSKVERRTSYGIGASIRFGNRWTLPIGLTLGFSYLGAMIMTPYSILIFSPEIGWAF